MKILYRLLFMAVTLIITCYCVVGFSYVFTSQSFCGKVNRFVVTKNGDEVISLVVDGEARGYVIKNVFHPPFAIALGAQKRRERLVLEQHYNFRSAGFRIFAIKPVLTYDQITKDNTCP